MKLNIFKKITVLSLVFMLVIPSFLANFATKASAAAVAEDLFISEYIEGSGFNKAFEIFNGTGDSVDLAQYSVELYTNGGTEAGSTVKLEGALQDNDVYVIAHGSAADAIKGRTDLTSGVANFNGNDVVVLKKNDQIIDIFGEIGSTVEFAKDQTLTRQSGVLRGSTVYSAAEWNAHPADTFSFLGTHDFARTEVVEPDPEPAPEPDPAPEPEPEPTPEPDKGYLTVAEAIADNTGEASVQGYIVGTKNEAEAPFGTATNLMLADSPTETDASKMIPVQLSSGSSTRAALNLVDNPEMYLAKVQITGNLETYYSMPGLKSPKEFTILEEVQAPEEERDYLTVAEAIADNSGDAKVQGYIIGTQNETEGPFGTATNLMLADSPTETDTSKIIPVQLSYGSSTRAALNLVDNPEMYLAKVQITGSLEAYFGMPGLKSPSDYSILEEGQAPEELPQPEPGEVISIQEARSMGNGSEVTVEAVVTADNSAIGAGKLSTYIQDETGGINIFDYTSQDLKEGDKVKVTGKIAEYKKLKEIISPQIEVLGSGEAIPEPKEITLEELQSAEKAEELEGQLVTVNGFVKDVPATPVGGGYNVNLLDEDYNGATLRVIEETNSIDSIESGKWYEVTGVLSQYDSYQILPRKAGDLKLADEQPEAPSAAGEYTSEVSRVVDGDTINLSDPVLGSTKVRFLNIDTPETYAAHNSDPARDEFSANQLEKGKEATEYIKTLIQEGDEVIIKIGEEPMDDYGRLLAQVIRKSDGKNINLEMVEKGYAVTYFIWPVGEKEEYEEYQSAVKTAKEQEIGIWNPENPLLELPFEFRANDDEKGFSRVVGNSDTMNYVEPEEWAEVAVEKRIFFSSPEEAEEQGYTPAVEETDEETPEVPSGDLVSLQLLSANDLHGMIDLTTARDGLDYGRADYLAAYMREREQENPNTLMLHAGDMIGGSPLVSALYQDEPTVEILNSIGFDIGTVGNHEFDEGTQELLRMVNGGEHPEGKGTENYSGMDTKMLCANCVWKDSGETILDAYTIEEVDGVEVGFIGVNTPATATMVIPSGISDIEFTDPAAAVDKAVAELKAQGVRAIVVLTHMPATQNGDGAAGDAANLAKSVDDEVDVIYAAHNHQKVNAVVDNKLIVQAWEYGKAFADVDVEIDRSTGDIVQKSAEIVEVVQQGAEPDTEVGAILKKYEDLVEETKNELVGNSAQTLDRSYPTKDQYGDPGVGNLLADSMKASMESDFALMNGGGVRNPLEEGPITWGELFNITPFGNYLVKVEVTGDQFKEILGAMLDPNYGPDSFIAGARYTWNPIENEIVDVFMADGSELEPDKTYSVVVNNYMYENTEHSDYKLLSQYGKDVVNGKIDVEALVDYVKSFEMEPIVYANEGEGRIEAIKVNTEDLGEVTIQEARDAGAKKQVTIEGVVTAAPGVWGSNGYYVQDETSGIFVNGADVELGDHIKVTGITVDSAGEFQLNNLIGDVEIIDSVSVPDPIELDIDQVNDKNEGKLAVVKNVTIADLEKVNSYGTFEFNAVKDGESVLVRVDNRAGVSYDSFAFANGDSVDVTGVVGEFNGTMQLKPRMESDIAAASKEEEDPASEDEDQTDSDENPSNEEQDNHKTIEAEKKNGKYVLNIEDIDQLESNSVLTVMISKEMKSIVSLTAQQIAELQESNVHLEVDNGEVAVKIPAMNLPEGKSAEITVTEVEVKGAFAAYDFTITVDNEAIHQFEEEMTLVFTIDSTKVKNTENLKVFYFNEETNEWELVGGVYKDGKVSAKTDHFSTFAVMETAGTNPDTDEDTQPVQDPSGDDNSESDDSSNQDKETKETDSTPAPVEESKDTKLPETGTDVYSLLLLGFVLISFAGAFYWVRRRA
ncbi:DUF6359 domain-containing protein [Rossellomorea aquimaris]|nr:DUF6359 domain-containing protein [Rossellomorea vietnamensis]